MKEMGLRAIQPKNFIPKTSDGKALKPAPNLLTNHPLPSLPNQVWTGDIIPSRGVSLKACLAALTHTIMPGQNQHLESYQSSHFEVIHVSGFQRRILKSLNIFTAITIPDVNIPLLTTLLQLLWNKNI